MKLGVPALAAVGILAGGAGFVDLGSSGGGNNPQPWPTTSGTITPPSLRGPLAGGGSDNGIDPEDMPLADVDNDGTISPTERENWINGLNNTTRGTDGVHISTYGQADDSTPDSNTRAQRGFSNNLLREGSVALSPEIYQRYNPPIGSAVYVNGQHIGYYEDRTPGGYNGNSYGKTIDVYDPNNRLGPVLKNAGSNATISFGPPRTQISNP